MICAKLTKKDRIDIRRDAERSCVGASVGDTLRLLDDYDALAQRCKELEAVLDQRNAECDRLILDVEHLREIREIASQCAANGGYLCSADLIELRELLRR